MVLTGNRRHSKLETKYNNHTLENPKSYKCMYLGILFTCAGICSPANTDLYQKCLKAIFKLMKLINNNNLNYQTAIHLFDRAAKKTILMYCSEVWVPLNNHNSIEKIITQITESVLEKNCH